MSKNMQEIQSVANSSAYAAVHSPEEELSKAERDTVLVHGRSDIAAVFITNFYILRQIKLTNFLLMLILFAIVVGMLT